MNGGKDRLETDGGYGWVVCFASFVVHVVVCGLQNNFGLLYIYILKELSDGGKAKSAWVGSINIGVTYLISPFVTAACDRVGCRVTGLVGGLVCVTGLVCSSFSRNVYLLYASYGVGVGIGCGTCYITTFKTLSLWFNRRLALVNYLSQAGDSIGGLAMGPCLQRMLATLGLSWTFLILAGMFSINSLMAVFYRMPPKKTNEENDMVETKGKRTRFDFTVLKHNPYVFYVIGSNVFFVAFSVTYVHVPSFAKEEGVPETKAALLVGIEALSGLLAILCLGRVVNKYAHYRLEIYQLGILGIGLTQTFLATARSFPIFVALIVFHGINSAIACPLRPVLAEQLVGKDRASEGVGLLFGTLGFAYIAGPPLAGWIYDISHSYPVAFFVAGGLCSLACCILFLVRLFEGATDMTTSTRRNESKHLVVSKSPTSCHEKTHHSKIQLPHNIITQPTDVHAEIKEIDV